MYTWTQNTHAEKSTTEKTIKNYVQQKTEKVFCFVFIKWGRRDRLLGRIWYTVWKHRANKPSKGVYCQAAALLPTCLLAQPRQPQSSSRHHGNTGYAGQLELRVSLAMQGLWAPFPEISKYQKQTTTYSDILVYRMARDWGKNYSFHIFYFYHLWRNLLVFKRKG